MTEAETLRETPEERDARKLEETLAGWRAKGVEILDTPPEGWYLVEGTLTQPAGYHWYYNHESLFSGRKKSALVKDSPKALEAAAVAREIRRRDTWDNDLNLELCTLAGLEAEYRAADADNFESIVYQAAKILSVDI